MASPRVTQDDADKVQGLPLDELDYLAKLERGRRLDLDVRGVLALITLSFFCLLVLYQVVTMGKVTVPAEVAAVVTGVMGWYFGSKGGSGT